MNEQHLGSSLDDFLTEEGRLAEAEAVASNACWRSRSAS